MVCLEKELKCICLRGLNYYISNTGEVYGENKKQIKLRKDKDGYLVFTCGKRGTGRLQKSIAWLPLFLWMVKKTIMK